VCVTENSSDPVLLGFRRGSWYDDDPSLMINTDPSHGLMMMMSLILQREADREMDVGTKNNRDAGSKETDTVRLLGDGKIGGM